MEGWNYQALRPHFFSKVGWGWWVEGWVVGRRVGGGVRDHGWVDG